MCIARSPMENKSNAFDMPSGFRFLPSDSELINDYLSPKVLRHALPADIIPILEVFQINPWDLPGDSEEKRYFFCAREEKANKYKLSSDSGYWKATGKQQVIWNTQLDRAPRTKAIGLKRRLRFCPNIENLKSHPISAKTQTWVMWEYRLATSVNNTSRSDKKSVEEVGDWMVCAIITKKMKKPIDTNGPKQTN